MKCKYCNSELKEGDKFCRNCGATIEKEKKTKKTKKVEEEVVEPVVVETPVTPVTPTNNESNGLAIASIIIGAASFFFGWFLWILPIIGLILGICCKKKCTEKTTGIILNSIALFIVVIVAIIFFSIIIFAGALVTRSDFDPSDIFDDYPYTEHLENESIEWSTHKSLRRGELGYNLEINGLFRILDNTTEAWKFNSGEFYWYKDINDTDDNYWTGKYNVLIGKEGLTALGIDETKIEDLIMGTDVKNENIYALEITPSKIISGGVDKSSTNIPENTKWTYVWILVDHGSEGIEARVLNADTNKTSYFVKLAD